MAVAGVNAGTGTADAGPSSASKPIEEIQVGDFVWARAEHDPSAPAVLQKVVALYRNTAHDLQTLEVVGEQGSAEPLGQSVQIVATDEHPFYVVDVGWTTADAIQVGQKLVGAGGDVLTVVTNRDWKPDGGVVVYNFQVEGDHTYFVGDIHAQGEWVWTHNACGNDNFDFGKHLRKLIGDPPVGMVDPHAHHILFKKGLGETQQDLVGLGQSILKKVGIDPIYGKENLVWAPWRIVGQHGVDSVRRVVSQLVKLDALGGDHDAFRKLLKSLGNEAAKRG